jgi:hypothetical protein
VDDQATELLALARAIPAPGAGPLSHTLLSVGLTEGKLDLLETHIETYNLLLGSSHTARGTKTAATVNLAATWSRSSACWRKASTNSSASSQSPPSIKNTFSSAAPSHFPAPSR